MLALKIENLSKTYNNGVQALKNIDLAVPAGMFGLLGPNGAGKSTLMRTIATLQDPDRGNIFLGNTDVLRQKKEIRRILGYLPQDFGLYPDVTAEAMLNHFAVLKGITVKGERREMIRRLLQETGLYDHRRKKLGTYSGGMKQRFGVAQALLGNPKLIIVDEPSAGLDPEARNHVLNLLSDISEDMVVILSTHIVEDVSELCGRMAVLSMGKVLLTGEPQEAVENLKGNIWKKIIRREELEDYYTEYEVISARLAAGKPVIHVFGKERPGKDFEQVDPDLEDVYFSTINRK
jgi:ABC-2 type transport system ATP-binding protein